MFKMIQSKEGNQVKRKRKGRKKSRRKKNIKRVNIKREVEDKRRWKRWESAINIMKAGTL